MDLLGPNLETLFEACNKKLSYKTVLMVADQVVSDNVIYIAYRFGVYSFETFDS